MVQGPGPHAGEDAHGHGHEHAGPGDHGHHGFADAARAIGRSQRARRLRTGALVAVFTIALLTLAAEFLLRAMDHRERALEANVTRTNRRWVELTRAGLFEELDDPVRRYAMRPGADAVVDGWRFRVSNARTRGPEVPADKPAGERRILCLGDSFAFGLWCDEDETVVARLAAAANAAEAERGSGITWRPLDLGVPGYHLGQTLRAFEQDGLALAPDVVVLYSNTNDIEQTGFHYDEDLGVLRRDYLPLPEGLKRVLWDWSHLYGWIAGKHARAVEAGPTPYLEPRVPWAHVRADNQAYTRDALARLAELCRARDLPLFVINQPLITWLGGTRRDDWPVLPLDAWFRGVCAELELPTLHLLGLFRGYADNVDRLEAGVPPDLLTDRFIADEVVQEGFAAVRAKAAAAGEDWDALPLVHQVAWFEGMSADMPAEPDFHLTGEAYAAVARLAYARMEAEGMLP